MDNDRSGTDNAACADRDSGQHRHIAAQPCVIAYGNGESRLAGTPPAEIVDGMLRSKQMTVRTNFHVMANGDIGTVENRAVVIDKRVLSHSDAIAMITMKRRTDARRVGYAWHQIAQRLAVPG